MLGGNQVYDIFIFFYNLIYFGVVEVIFFIRNSFGSLNYEEELIVCFIKEVCVVDEFVLSYQFSRRFGNVNVIFIIINGMIIIFVVDLNGSVFVLDSYFYFLNGVLFVKCKRDDIEGFLNWLKVKLLIGINLCIVIFIKFN